MFTAKIITSFVLFVVTALLVIYATGDRIFDVASFVEQGRREPMVVLLMLTVLLAIAAAFYFQRKLHNTVTFQRRSVRKNNPTSSFHTFRHQRPDPEPRACWGLLATLRERADRLHRMAAHEAMVEFEVRLLEKWAAADTVWDWREYVADLLVDINEITKAYTLFVVIKVNDHLFALEIFWSGPPLEESKRLAEVTAMSEFTRHSRTDGPLSISMHHHITQPGNNAVVLPQRNVRIQSIVVETPRAGGIVAVGLHVDEQGASDRLPLMERSLATMLPLVGSVKAICQQTQDLKYYATRDPLTNLPNQHLFWELLALEINRAGRLRYPCALLVFQLENFKWVDSRYGRHFSKKFLHDFTIAIGRTLRNGDILARYGVDQFAVILPDAPNACAQTVARRILDAGTGLTLAAPDQTPLAANVSIGIAVYPDHPCDARALYRLAENNMVRRAGTKGDNPAGYPTPEEFAALSHDLGQKWMVVADGIEKRKIVPYFQPILSAKTGALLAVEALSRLDLGGDQTLVAREFIELTERLGLIHTLDYAMVELTLEQVRRCGYQGLIFLNLSPRVLAVREFVREIRAIALRHGIPTSRIVFEINERDTIRNTALLEHFVKELKIEGLGLAIDNYGAGFPSFHYLKRFPVDYVKIDGEFVVNMGDNAHNAAFVKTMGALARELGIQPIAKGVETERLLKGVRQAGIDYAQGYHLGRPAPRLAAIVAPFTHRVG